MAKIGCIAANHKFAYTNDNEEVCLTCADSKLKHLKKMAVAAMEEARVDMTRDEYTGKAMIAFLDAIDA